MTNPPSRPRRPARRDGRGWGPTAHGAVRSVHAHRLRGITSAVQHMLHRITVERCRRAHN
eukprot:6352450-Prymnesium_polylepis.1